MESFDLNDFANRYADAWCSQKPEKVAAFFSEEGSLAVNEDPPAVGRSAIADVARGFMTAFPDMVVTCDRLQPDIMGTEFHWTLTGTNSGPGGTGKRVRISGYELWQLDAEGLIRQSEGRFDTEDYARQLKQGSEE